MESSRDPISSGAAITAHIENCACTCVGVSEAGASGLEPSSMSGSLKLPGDACGDNVGPLVAVGRHPPRVGQRLAHRGIPGDRAAGSVERVPHQGVGAEGLLWLGGGPARVVLEVINAPFRQLRRVQPLVPARPGAEGAGLPTAVGVQPKLEALGVHVGRQRSDSLRKGRGQLDQPSFG
eukprot:scaffold2187_cov109-Isochrysis_galbana.AAC.8